MVLESLNINFNLFQKNMTNGVEYLKFGDVLGISKAEAEPDSVNVQLWFNELSNSLHLLSICVTCS